MTTIEQAKFSITIDEDTFQRIENALNTAIGMASVHNKDGMQKLLDLADELSDHWNETAAENPDSVAVNDERKRCAAIAQAARVGERDTDLRSIIYAIKNP